ncbi:hypothetical protein BDV27DRAFT_171801 [Aspergillus caelatus]|uniref:DUF2306 domain-containing protein n=1 Tax=Aspergillus caelatus TaxID=61420 RepID=A0A5N7A5X3_9EURO|nr:uncharacterized protein BDV27DRAFT_171801 [Aspergillus caelatus]KAE8365232.1 hypothetical protein BDV27DRAFT_171801 [Aspergillus caelatus]
MSPIQVPKPNTDTMGQDIQIPKRLSNGFGLVYKRTVQVMVISMVIFFAPLSFTYFFDKTHTSNLSDKVLAILISPKFAYGEGSGTMSDVKGGQMVVYLRNLTAMFSHTIAGSIAIVIGLVQFNTTLQFKYPVIHRYLGRLYFLCAMTITWSSRSFLADAVPTKEVFSGDPFAYILSSLSISLPLTMACAIYAIWNRDIGSHREFMVLNYAFMLSAPILRVQWITLGRLWGETKYIVNLYSSIFSGPFLVAASIFYLRQRHVRPSNSLLTNPNTRIIATASGLLGLLFLAIKGPSFNGGPRPKAFWLALGPQLICYMALFTAFARAAKRRGDMRSYTAWITYQNGLISAPMWSVLVMYMARNHMSCSEDSLGLITVAGGISQGLFMSFMVYVFATSTLVNPYRRAVKSR